VSVNGTSWRRAFEYIASISHVVDHDCGNEIVVAVLVQEHKLIDEASIEEQRDRLAAMGWRSYWRRALVCDSGKASGGVCICARDECGLDGVAVEWVGEACEHRLAVAQLSVPGIPPLPVGNVYLRDSCGMDEYNLQILASAMATFDAMGGSAGVLAGDFNNGPGAVWKTDVMQQASMRLLWPDSPTFVTKVARTWIDYFALGLGMIPIVHCIGIDARADVSPHRAVKLVLRHPHEMPTVDILKRPARLPVRPVVGPLRRPADEHEDLWCRAQEAIQHVYDTVQAGGLVAQHVPEMHTRVVQNQLDWAWQLGGNAVWGDVLRACDKQHPGGPKPGDDQEVKKVRLTFAQRTRRWKSYGRPLRWLRHRAQHLRCLLGKLHIARGQLADMYIQEIDDVRSDLHVPPFPLDSGGEHMRMTLIHFCLQAMHPRSHRSVADELMCLERHLDASIDSIAEVVARAERIDSSDATSRWTEWVAEASLRGARRLHQWAKAPDGGALQQRDPCGVSAQSRDRVLQQEAKKLGAIWAVQAWEHGGMRDEDSAELIPIHELQWASGSFGEHAAQSQDGLHPRHHGMAGTRALQLLAVILYIFERTTCLPSQLLWIVSFLLEKSGGRGYRAINLFASPYRIWVRVRRSRMRAWEMSYSRDYTAFTAGGGCVSTVFRQSLRSEVARAGRGSFVGIFWDLWHFYEQMKRGDLESRALRLQVPPSILHAALAMYRGKRVVSFRQASVYVGMATEGVPAGCGMATTFVIVYVLESIDKFVHQIREIGGIELDIFIDDYGLGIEGCNDDVVFSKTVTAADLLQKTLEDDLQLSIACNKSQVVASSTSLAKRVRRYLGHLGGCGIESANNLGIDFCLRARKLPVRRRRWHKFTLRMRKVRAIARRNRKAAVHILSTGLNPGLVYGGQVYGFSNREIRQLLRADACAHGMHHAGINLRKAAIINNSTVLPILLGPVHVWHSIVWQAGMGIGRTGMLALLRLAWEGVAKNPPRNQSQVMGGSSASWMCVRMIGWTWPAPFELMSDTGERYNMFKFSPKQLQTILVEALSKRWLHDDKHAVWHQMPVSVDPLKKFLRLGHVTDLAKTCLRIWASGGWWSPKRKFLAKLGMDDGSCPKCGAHMAGIEHIVFSCPATRQAVQHLDFAPLIVYFNADPVGKAAFKSGLIIDPSSFGPGPASDDAMEFWSAKHGDVFDASIFDGEIYIDGSGSNWANGFVKRATWSVVKMNDDCSSVVGWARGPVWRELPQSSGVAEWCALAAASQLAQNQIHVVTDYANIERGFREPHRVCSARNSCSGIAREAFFGKGRDKLSAVSWTKAHRDLQALQGEQKRQALGNRMADIVAKAAMSCHPQWSDRQIADSAYIVDLFSMWIDGVARALSAWVLTCQDDRPTLRHNAGPNRPRLRVHRHEHNHCLVWAQAKQMWRCMRCCHFFASLHIEGCKRTCKGHNSSLIALASDCRGHSLFVADFETNDGVAILCKRCGAWAVDRFRLLLEPCGDPSDCPVHAREALARRQRDCEILLSGRHPKKREVRVGPFVPFLH